MNSTLSILKHLFRTLPPLLPQDIKMKLGSEIENLDISGSLSPGELEAKLIEAGLLTWPWRRAYAEVLEEIEKKVGEHFLLPRLSESTAERYEAFKLYGGHFRDLLAGNPTGFFSLDQRIELAAALSDTMNDLRGAADREILGLSQRRYLSRVNEYQSALAVIEKALFNLRALAEREKDFPMLAKEILARVRGFEEGLCLLGPEISFEEVFGSEDFFADRREHLSRLRGIETSVEVDFYSNFA